MSDTPETDDQPCIMAINENGYQVPCVDIEYARKLERERDEAREDATNHYAKIGELERERDETRKERDEIRKHLAAANKGAEINAHINNSLTAKLAEARGVLQEIANASHFDNIGNWARNKAKEALNSI